MLVGDAVDEGHQEVEAGRERAGVLAQPLLDPGVLLGHDLDGAGDEDAGDDEKDEGDFHGVLGWPGPGSGEGVRNPAPERRRKEKHRDGSAAARDRWGARGAQAAASTTSRFPTTSATR